MGTVQGTLRLHTASEHWRARLACALMITVMVGVLTYAATYRALVVMSTPGATASVVPGTSSGTVTHSSAPPVVSLPGH